MQMIFVGEHTSYTHAWIASALESGIRGSVQLLLELGLVDEAKATVEKWMARWIDVVSTGNDGGNDKQLTFCLIVIVRQRVIGGIYAH